VALARGSRVELEDLPEEVRQAARRPLPTKGLVRPLDQIEKESSLAALELNGGNQTHTADQLKIGSATLYRKLKTYGQLGGKRTPATKGERTAGAPPADGGAPLGRRRASARWRRRAGPASSRGSCP